MSKRARIINAYVFAFLGSILLGTSFAPGAGIWFLACTAINLAQYLNDE